MWLQEMWYLLGLLQILKEMRLPHTQLKFKEALLAHGLLNLLIVVGQLQSLVQFQCQDLLQLMDFQEVISLQSEYLLLTHMAQD